MRRSYVRIAVLVLVVVVVSEVLSFSEAVLIDAETKGEYERIDSLESIDTFLYTTRNEITTLTNLLTYYKNTRENSRCCEGE